MKKFFTTFLLLVIILGTFSFIYLKYSAAGPDNNEFNSSWRYKFARYPMARKILSLHYDGDAKADYLGSKYPQITIKVIMMDKIATIDKTILETFSRRIQETTGKKTNYTFVGVIPFKSPVNLDELRQEIRTYRNYNQDKNAASLFLVLADKNKGDADSVGYTLDEDSVVLFENMISENYRKNEKIEVFNNYSSGVLLHEFGHQIGLDHNNQPGCIMNQIVELGDIKPGEITTDFCSYEKDLIQKMQF